MNYPLKQHPLSAAFPAMSAEDFEELKSSVQVNGVLNPITLFEGMVIDGWHRYTAAMQLNMDCPKVILEETEQFEWIDVRDFVLAQNQTRRHITKAQLALAIATVYKWQAGHPKKNSAGTAELKQTEIAKKNGLSSRTLQQANQVDKTATPEVKEAVKAGKIGLEKAAAIAKLPQAEQAQAIAKPLPKPELKVVQAEPTPEPEEEYTELDAAHDKIAELQDALAVANVGSSDADEAQQAAQLIAELRAEIKRLEISLKAVTASRDIYMNQVAEMQRQINRQRREIDRATGTRTA